MLIHLLYISHRSQNCTDLEIKNILQSCQKNNPSIGITGVLMYSEKKFLQYVEGDSTNIFQLYEKIKADSRHNNLALISLTTIQERIFPNWNMGKKQVSSKEIDYLTELTKEDREIFDKMIDENLAQGHKVQKALNALFNQL